MGYYIETGKRFGKAEDIIHEHNGKPATYDSALATFDQNPRQDAVIVVVTNGSFEAAALAFDRKEFDRFMWPGDQRAKRIITIPWQTAVELTGYKGTPCYAK